jgi:hypothetical protein
MRFYDRSPENTASLLTERHCLPELENTFLNNVTVVTLCNLTKGDNTSTPLQRSRQHLKAGNACISACDGITIQYTRIQPGLAAEPRWRAW